MIYFFSSFGASSSFVDGPAFGSVLLGKFSDFTFGYSSSSLLKDSFSPFTSFITSEAGAKGFYFVTLSGEDALLTYTLSNAAENPFTLSSLLILLL